MGARGSHAGAVVSVATMMVGPYRVELTRKQIKRAYLRLDDPCGPVRVSAPVRMPVRAVEKFVESNAAWIERRRACLAAFGPASARRGHVADDGTVLVWGVPRPAGELVANMPAERVEAGVRDALRDELLRAATPLVRRYEGLMGVRVRELRTRDMQTRWGSCNVEAHRVWLAVSLAHYDRACLELVVVHELCHLLERGHGPRFRKLMTRYLPDWKQREALLKSASRGR